jgi:hypothetical protein
MRKLAFVALIVLAPLIARAATTSATFNWIAPTTAVDGSPLTGAQAITSYQIWIATSSIPDNVATAATATITTGTTTTQSITANPGDTIYARVKACNGAGCSVLSNQATKVIPLSVPGPPTSVTITLNVS